MWHLCFALAVTFTVLVYGASLEGILQAATPCICPQPWGSLLFSGIQYQENPDSNYSAVPLRFRPILNQSAAVHYYRSYLQDSSSMKIASFIRQGHWEAVLIH
ncbi:hypothetical protein B0O99DRAFT_608702 [Bisporella sp. PMI_857]|nr:hypothetical protein B0O99DRAFT_608702 [Bisporella sp. PMI_857]